MLPTQMARWLQTASRFWAGLLEKGKRKCLVKRWDRKPRPWQEREGYDSCSRAAQTDMLRQPCGGSWDVAHHSGLTPTLAWFKRIVVVGDGSKSKPAIKGECFGQWLGNIIPLDERGFQLASLWAGVSETNSLSISRADHSLSRCLCPESGCWLMFAYCGYPKIGWTAIYCHASGRWPSDDLWFFGGKKKHLSNCINSKLFRNHVQFWLPYWIER